MTDPTPLTDAAAMRGLKPCPFCGSKPALIGGVGLPLYVRCVAEGCEAIGPVAEDHEPKTTARLWNTRALPLPEAPAAVASVPAGWKLVPVEPTESMFWAGSDKLSEMANDQHAWSIHAKKVYAAMLAAAPTPAPDPAIGELVEALREGQRALAAMIRLADMGLEDSMNEPEEDGNYTAYTRAKAVLPKIDAALARMEVK